MKVCVRCERGSLNYFDNVKDAHEFAMQTNAWKISFDSNRWVRHQFGEDEEPYIEVGQLASFNPHYSSENRDLTFWINQPLKPCLNKGPLGFQKYTSLKEMMNFYPNESDYKQQFEELFGDDEINPERWHKKHQYKILEVLTDDEFIRKYCK